MDSASLLGITEAAEVLSVSTASLRRWTNAGQLACVRVGPKRERRFRREDLLAFLEPQPVRPVSHAHRPGDAGHPHIAHIAQMHRNPEGRIAAASRFLEDGIGRGEGAIVIACTESIDRILQELERAGHDADRLRREGGLRTLDASAVLDRILVEGMPAWEPFRALVGGAVAECRQGGTRAHRAYGEMVDALWTEGRFDAAIRLEEHWNRLAQEEGLAVLCGYLMRGFEEETFGSPLHRIGGVHAEIVESAEDVRFRSAVDRAAGELLELSLSSVLGLSGEGDPPGEERIPLGPRTMRWVQRHLPTRSAAVLRRALRHYRGR